MPGIGRSSPCKSTSASRDGLAIIYQVVKAIMSGGFFVNIMSRSALSRISASILLPVATMLCVLADDEDQGADDKTDLSLSTYTVNRNDFAEAVVTLSDGSQRETVRSWFQESGFNVIDMRAGLLITGDVVLFDSALQTAIGAERTQTRRLPVPEPLQDLVEEILLPRTPGYSKPSNGE